MSRMPDADPKWIPALTRSDSFFDTFSRKGANPEITHYCPGCGHGIVHKLIAEAIDDLGIQDRTILVNSVGCSVFAYYYFDVGNVQCPHGRAPAVATGIKRARPGSIVITYQGDGDLAAIGGNEVIHAANRGEGITIIFVNNAIYGMTGGQMAPTTLIGQKTTTTPAGRDPAGTGYPLRIVEIMNTLEAPAFLTRVSLQDARQTMRARKAIRTAIRNQVEGKGFSLVEVLSTCPAGWKMDPLEACEWIPKKMVPVFPLGELRNTTGKAVPPKRTPPARTRRQLNRCLGLVQESGLPQDPPRKLDRNLGIKVAGFGGQGALMLGLALAEAGRAQGYEVSWLPSYGPEMRGGTAHCHVTFGSDPIGCPIVNHPNILVAMNRPSLERFLDSVEPGGWIFYDSSLIETPPRRKDVKVVPIPAARIADSIGTVQVANMVILGALVARLRIPSRWAVARALLNLVKSDDLRIANESAIEAGWGLGADQARLRSSHQAG